MELRLEPSKCTSLRCQAISKVTSNGEDDFNSLCALTWYSHVEEKNKLLLFDLNQWYKEEMPFSINWQENPSYIAAYILCKTPFDGVSLDFQLTTNTIANFNSLQRCEEHFYPNSLSFGK